MDCKEVDYTDVYIGRGNFMFSILSRSPYTCTIIAKHPNLLEYILILYASIKVKIMKVSPIFFFFCTNSKLTVCCSFLS